MRVLGRLDINPTRLAVLQRCGRVSEAGSLESQFQAHVARMQAVDARFGAEAAPMFRNADGTITISAEQVQTPFFHAFQPDHEAFRHCLMANRDPIPTYAMAN